MLPCHICCPCIFVYEVTQLRHQRKRELKQVRMSGSTRPKLALSRDDRLMTWSASLNIYRVNRFQSTEEIKRESTRFDLVEQLLMRNMLDEVEAIFAYVGLESVSECLLVCRLWRDFLTNHLFKRWAERLLDQDEGLRELAEAERWQPDGDDDEDDAIYGRICRRIFELREVWRYREPKLRRLFCDSFVLSLKFDGDSLYCGLNNGSLQLWDLDWAAKKREQEVHEKGVKSLDVNQTFIATGSYDCTAKVWLRSSWSLLHVITIHSDSVWDLKLQDNDRLVTAGLDGAVGMFQLTRDKLDVCFVMQSQEDLVSSVDFDYTNLVTGYEDAHIRLWTLTSIGPPMMKHRLIGHTGGVTGLQLNAASTLLASGSYDGTVRLWNLGSGDQVAVFNEPQHFVRCLSFKGNALAAGDFGGNVHLWDLKGVDDYQHRKRHRCFASSHKGHVVSVQIDARRIVSGSRDKTALVQDFWAKMLEELKRRRKEREGDRGKTYRFWRPSYR